MWAPHQQPRRRRRFRLSLNLNRGAAAAATAAISQGLTSGRDAMTRVARKYSRPFHASPFSAATLVAEEFSYVDDCPLPATRATTAAAGGGGGAGGGGPVPDAGAGASAGSADDPGATSGPYIRLVELFPPDEPSFSRRLPLSTAPAVRVRLFTAPLDMAPPYEALSYAWESERRTETVYVGGHHEDPDDEANNHSAKLLWFDVTESVDAALRHLRHPTESVFLWVDQLCIDLESPREKAAQVALMGRIFRRADRVLAWLGPASRRSNFLMSLWSDVGADAAAWGLGDWDTPEKQALLRRIAAGREPEHPSAASFRDLCRRSRETFWPRTDKDKGKGKAKIKNKNKSTNESDDDNDDDDDDTSSTTSSSSLDSYGSRERDWRAVGASWAWHDRPWFRRAWAVQEFAFAKEVVLVSGDKRVDARWAYYSRLLWECASRLSSDDDDDNNKTDKVDSNDRSSDDYDDDHEIWRQNPLRVLFTIRRMREQFESGNGPGMTLYELILCLYARDDGMMWSASNRRDHIFALLGLASDAGALGIAVNYTTSIHRDAVFARAVRAMIRQAGNLDLLGLVRFPKVDASGNLPSWVPDLAHHLRQPSQWTVTATTGAGKPAAAVPAFSASGGARVELVPIEEELTLGLVGVLVDEVKEVGTPQYWMFQSGTMPILTEIRLLCALSDNMHQLRRATAAAAAAAATATGRSSTSSPSSPSSLSSSSSSPACRPTSSPPSSVADDPVYPNHPWRRPESVWRIPLGDIELLPDGTSRRAPRTVGPAFRRLLASRERAEQNKVNSNPTPASTIPPPPGVPPSSTYLFNGSLVTTRPPPPPVDDEVRARHRREACLTARMGTVCAGRRAFLTRHRGYVGVGPTMVQPGDLVVVFLGADVPYVLRPKGGGRRYFLLGDAYCDGIMDGEAMKEAKREAFFLV